MVTPTSTQVILKGGPANGDVQDAPTGGELYVKAGSATYGPWDGFSEFVLWNPLYTEDQ